MKRKIHQALDKNAFSLQKQHAFGLRVSAMGTFRKKTSKDQGRSTEIDLSELMRVIKSDSILTTWGEVASKLRLSIQTASFSF